MDETQNQTVDSTTAVSTAPEVTVTKTNKQPIWLYTLGLLLVIGVLVGAVYMLEQQGTLRTGLFVDKDGIAPKEVVAVVNGTEILGSELVICVSQISANAQANGINISDPAIQADIETQAVDTLINTKLLEQEATSRGINITDADVDARINLLVEQVGSMEALQERMTVLGITDATLRRDVKSELTIQALLDGIFLEKEIAVTEEEALALYETRTAGLQGVPPFEELREQFEAEVRASKEQPVITAFIDELRAKAQIEVVRE
jgi:FKBP-type peptidyl-prolyl cis-trans isomerase (trigger factor)